MPKTDAINRNSGVRPSTAAPDVLSDVLAPGLRLVFCGTAAGHTSAAKQAYYAHPSNKFWGVLHRVGLTPTQLPPQRYNSLLTWRIGLTDLVKTTHGSDSELPKSAYDTARLRAAIERYKPGVLAFNGKQAAKTYFSRTAVYYGRQAETIGDTLVYVLPSTSAAAMTFWDEGYWRDLADQVR